MSLPFAQSLGLSAHEGDLYELLLRLGEVPAADIIREAKLKRSTAYKILYTLEEKGLITKRDIKKKIHFRPVSPTKLLEHLEEQSKSIDNAKKQMHVVVPQLLSLYTLSVEKPVVQMYEGVEGLIKIYEDTLVVEKEIDAFLQAADIDPTLEAWLEKTYVKKRVKANLPAKVIVATSKESFEYQKRDEKELRQTVHVSNIQFPFEHEIDIYGNKIAFINYKKGTALIGVVITHPLIAKTMKAIFDLAWKGAEKQKNYPSESSTSFSKG